MKCFYSLNDQSWRKMLNLRLDKKTHTYYLDGRPIPGVTGILEAEGITDFSMVPEVRLEASKLFGTATHVATHLYDLGILDWATVSPPIIPYLNGWIKFLKDYNIKKHEHIEKIIYSRIWNFAGTLDRINRPNNKLTVIDLKTPTSVSPGNFLQTGAYKIGYEEMTGERIKQRWIVQLKPEGYKIHPCTATSDESVFKALALTHNWKLLNLKRRN